MEQKKINPIFSFMAIGSAIYALFYTFFLYKNAAGITYPFFVGGTCLFFFLYLKKSGITAKRFSIFLTVSLLLLGISTCLTDSWVIHFLNKIGILILFFYLVLHNLYDDKKWDLLNYLGSIMNVIVTSLIYVFKPFEDFADFCKARNEVKNKKSSKGSAILFGLLISLPLVLIVVILLCSADAVFSSIFSTLTYDFINFLFDGNIMGIMIIFLFAFFASYCIMSRISVHDLKEDVANKRTSEPIVGITFTGILSCIYFIFCLIQIIYLFGGLGTLPEGYTYASYAREGFFQLVFVCLINLVMVLICLKLFKPNKVLKGILIFISFCTYIMIASSVYRMLLYVDVYYLTFLRVFVLWSLLIIFLLMTGTLLLICKEDFPFVRYSLITVTVLYLLFSFAQPDYWIAHYNINRSYGTSALEAEKEGGKPFKDYDYFTDLSLDAAPVIIKNADKLGYNEDNWFLSYCSGIVRSTYPLFSEPSATPKQTSIRKWNLSRWTSVTLYLEYYDSHEAFATGIKSFL